MDPLDLFPGSVDTTVLKDTLADLLPTDNYTLETIKGTSSCFKGVFHLSCKTETEANSFVHEYCKVTKEILKSATSR